MKKLILIVMAIVFMAVPAMAEQANLNLTWQDDNVKYEGYSWKLFQRIAGQGFDYTAPIATITWKDGQTEYSTTEIVTVDGAGGEVVTLEFVIRAVSAKGVVSADSNVASYPVEIPLNAPYSLVIKLVIE